MTLVSRKVPAERYAREAQARLGRGEVLVYQGDRRQLHKIHALLKATVPCALFEPDTADGAGPLTLYVGEHLDGDNSAKGSQVFEVRP